eukprot:COSAG03_NODE_2622_length_2586_cov_2.036590_4_plen_92_part_00
MDRPIRLRAPAPFTYKFYIQMSRIYYTEQVRLHQPYESFTAHDREWAFSKTKPKAYLASKTEILSHFADIAAACVAFLQTHGILLALIPTV